MKYTSIKDGRKSNSKSTMVKHLLVFLMITMSLVFSGASSTPINKASAPCDMVCGDPFTDPNTGQCVVMCCPVDNQCKSACELRPCK
jgi:hypothetical protein